MESLIHPLSLSDIFNESGRAALTKLQDFSLVVVDQTGWESHSEWKKFASKDELLLQPEKSLSRALLRFFLSMELQADPLSLSIERTENGKPYLGGNSLSFNLSHSGNYWAMACSSQWEIGLDLETWKSWDRLEKIANRIFTENEKSELFKTAGSEERILNFLKVWTMKESLIKLDGLTLFQGLSEFEFDLASSTCLQRPHVRFTHFLSPQKFLVTCSQKAPDQLSSRTVGSVSF